jgi:hypothetical protein
MPHPRLSGDEVERRGQEIYERRLRRKVEPGNEGKILVIDVETGDYELDADEIAASRRALDKHPGAALWTLRIGFDAVHSLGGDLQPIKG